MYLMRNYRGTSQKVPSEFRVTPQAGLFLHYSALRLEVGYQYLQLNEFKISPHRIQVKVGFLFNQFFPKSHLPMCHKDLLMLY